MGKFCGICGTRLDENSGLCPNCNIDEKTVAVDFGATPVSSSPVAVQTPVVNEEKMGDRVHEPVYQPPVNNTSQNFVGTNVAFNNQPVVPSSKPVKVKKEKVRKPLKKATPLTTVVCVLLSICLFITATASLLVFGVRNAVKEDNAGKLINNLSVTDALDEFGAYSYEFLEDFYDYLYTEFDGFEVDDKDLDAFVTDSPVRDHIAEKIADFSEDIFDDGSAKFKIKRNDIVSTLKDCEDYLEDEFDVKSNSAQYVLVAEWILVDGDALLFDSDDLGGVVDVARYAFSYVALAALILLSALFVFVMCKSNFRQALGGIGITFTILGGLFSLVSLVTVIAPLWELLYENSVIILVIGNFFAINWLPSLIIFVLGVAMLVVKGIIKSKDAKNNA